MNEEYMALATEEPTRYLVTNELQELKTRVHERLLEGSHRSYRSKCTKA